MRIIVHVRGQECGVRFIGCMKAHVPIRFVCMHACVRVCARARVLACLLACMCYSARVCACVRACVCVWLVSSVCHVLVRGCRSVEVYMRVYEYVRPFSCNLLAKWEVVNIMEHKLPKSRVKLVRLIDFCLYLRHTM